MFKEIVDGFINAIFGVFVFAIMFVFPLYTFGPSFEARFFPVISNFTITNISHETYLDTNYNWYKVSFFKKRSCKIISETSAWYVVKYDNTQERVSFEEIGLLNVLPQRPVGQNNIPYVKVDNKSKLYKYQKLVLHYRCHPLWVTTQSFTFGEFPIK